MVKTRCRFKSTLSVATRTIVSKGSFVHICMAAENFKNVRLNGFDHDKTGFQLLGQHRVVKCGECHGTDLNSKPEHKNCTNCHKDYHKGEFISTGKSGGCSDCHTVNGFSPSLFTLELHQKNAVPSRRITSCATLPKLSLFRNRVEIQEG